MEKNNAGGSSIITLEEMERMMDDIGSSLWVDAFRGVIASCKQS